MDFSGIPWNFRLGSPPKMIGFFRRVMGSICPQIPRTKCRFRKLQVIYPGFLMGFEIQRTCFLVVMSVINVVSRLVTGLLPAWEENTNYTPEV